MTPPYHILLASVILGCALLFAPAFNPVAMAGSPPAPVSNGNLEWHTDLAPAMDEAIRNEKTILLRFTASWCPPCRVMDASVWTDSSVQSELADHYVIVKSDIDTAPSQLLAGKYGVRGVPTILLLDISGKEIARSGFMSSPETLKFLKTATEGSALR